MTDLQAIEKRVSRRTYTSGSIDIKKVNALKSEINRINNENGLNIIFMEDTGKAFNKITKSYGMFKGVTSIIVLKGKPNDSNLQEKVGYYGERLVLEATKLGLGTCWVGGTFDKKIIENGSPQSEKIICVITVGEVPIDKSAMENLIYKVTHRKTKGIENLIFSNDAVPDWFIYGVKAVLKAPSAMNRQAVQFKYQNKQASAYIDEKHSLALVDLGIAKLHFEIGAGGKFNFGNPGVFTHNKL